jgi:cardiolipin synthase
VISSPSDENHLLRKPFWLSFRCARERIWITTPYFVPDPAIREVLKERARAGVDVRALVPNEHIDLPVVRWAAQHYYQEMLEAGVRIWEYQPTMLHAKLLVVDGVWSIVGSANLDVRSGELNEEVIVGMLDSGFAADLESSFEHDLTRSREIRLEEWKQRSWFLRARCRACRVLEEQY